MRATGTAYVTLLRNTPLTLVLFFFALGFTKLFFYLPFFLLAVIGLSLYTAAFVCETVRGGISTVPEGQAEAARALGLGFTQTLTLIVLPQAVRSVDAAADQRADRPAQEHHGRGRLLGVRGRRLLPRRSTSGAARRWSPCCGSRSASSSSSSP